MTTVECLMETQFSQSSVWMAFLYPVFQHAPNQLFRCGCEAVITWETVSRSGTATTSSTGAPRGPVKLIGELTGKTAGKPVVVFP